MVNILVELCSAQDDSHCQTNVPAPLSTIVIYSPLNLNLLNFHDLESSPPHPKVINTISGDI